MVRDFLLPILYTGLEHYPYVLSQGDHRLNQVEAWATGLSHTLATCLDESVRPLDFSDDHLATVLDELSDDLAWECFEGALNRQTVRVYDLSVETVRLDTTTASSYRAPTTDGLFQFGHSKDKIIGLIYRK